MSDLKIKVSSPSTTVGESQDVYDLQQLGYDPEMRRNRNTMTLLFQSLAIAAIPYGFGSPLITAIYGGGQLSMFLGWVVVCILGECVALSLAELASVYPTSGGVYYWTYQLASPKTRTSLSFFTGWIWLIGNWTITLSVNFGLASLIAATVALYHPEYVMDAWQLLVIFYGICIVTFIIAALCNDFLPAIDTLCAAFTLVSIIATLICVAVKAGAGRHSPADTLGSFDPTLSGWGNFSFFIGMLPCAYTFSAVGMITSMAEECGNARVKLPRAVALAIPVGGIAGLFFVIPLCATLPDLTDIIANSAAAQSLPYIFARVMGSANGGMALTLLILIINVFCSISITVAASRCTWAFARDHALPFSGIWSKVNQRYGVPIWALTLTTLVQMLLGLINLGSSSAFVAFVSVGVIALAASYAIPIIISLLSGREQVNKAAWKMPSNVGWVVNVIAVLWILFEIILFCFPTTLPVTAVSMSYASVVFIGLWGLSAVWYGVHARKVFKGPPESAGVNE
uniref:Amino acid permease/ SLC12A domain-containing protein n=1 Tax=Bionectria ochroleuca TaxID=29856 RepID=A0A0B7JMQ3_BIOOC